MIDFADGDKDRKVGLNDFINFMKHGKEILGDEFND